jgi:elongator complex protein 3
MELKGAAQHAGLGKKLINKAIQIAKNNNFKKLAVISAIGTRKYYESRGFSRGEYYMVMDLTNK